MHRHRQISRGAGPFPCSQYLANTGCAGSQAASACRSRTPCPLALSRTPVPRQPRRGGHRRPGRPASPCLRPETDDHAVTILHLKRRPVAILEQISHAGGGRSAIALPARRAQPYPRRAARRLAKPDRECVSLGGPCLARRVPALPLPTRQPGRIAARFQRGEHDAAARAATTAAGTARTARTVTTWT